MSVENGRLLRDMNLNDEAIQVFKKVITDNPRDKLAFNELAFTYSLMKKHEEAITYVNATLHLDKDNVYARYLKGNSLISLDRTHQGIEELKKSYFN
jgi:tetratricopeptide (TPR) repeat protein